MKTRILPLLQGFKKGPRLYLLIAFLGTAATIIALQFAANDELPVYQATAEQEARFSNYISAYTVGVISANSDITVRFTSDLVDESQIGKEAHQDVFSFSPNIDGQAIWTDLRTLTFKPARRLTSGQAYAVAVALDELMETEPGTDDFSFRLQVMPQNFDLASPAMRPYDPRDLKKQKFIGSLSTADVADDATVEEMLTASQNGQALAIHWEHQGDGKQHTYTIENVARRETAGEVVVNVSGSPLGVDKKSEEKLRVPALGDFSLMEASVVQGDQQYLSLQFSDPLEENQQLNGLVRLEGDPPLRFLVAGNELKVYPGKRLNGSLKLEVAAGIKNLLGYKMKTAHAQSMQFEQLSPAVRLVKAGTILPSTDGLVLPFEAVSLKAVDVQIVEVFEENVGQFLQVNTLSGTRELKRVGRPIVHKTVPLNASGVTDLGKWNRFTLDLSKYLQAKPGALYQVTFNFRKQHAAFACGGQTAEKLTELADPVDTENWDKGDDSDYYYEYYDYDDYNYSERNDPCTASYYFGTRHAIKTNILASDLGLLAKRGEGDALLVVATDMLSAQPLKGAFVMAQNYQQQVIASGTTDAEGMLRLELKGKIPFLLVADYQKQKGYLKLDDGSALSMSNFDVAGEKIEKGLKGFLYAERDVWRPGDSLYVNFMLQDLENSLPENYPVSMELYNPQGQLIQKLVNANPVAGLYAFHTATEPEAPTGSWRAKVKVGGATFSKTLKIETIKPNRLKIRLNANGALKAGEKNYADLNVRWLHGATAKNLDAKVEMVLVPDQTSFPKFPGYRFDDPGKKFSASNTVVFEDAIDAQGLATISLDIPKQEQAPGKLKAVFKTKVFEEGGEFSIDRIVVPLHAFESYVGVKVVEEKAGRWLETNQVHKVQLATVDSSGMPIARSGLQLELIKLGWRWWWDQAEEGSANYIARSSQDVIAKGKTSTSSAGKGEWNFQVDYPQWGRYLLRVTDPRSGHSSGQIVYIDWPYGYDRSGRSNPDGASMLSLATDKEKYQLGQQAIVSFPSPAEGRALVSIENGSRIIKTFWAEIKKGQTEVPITLEESMAPNAYVHVSLLQPHRQTTNDLPIRLYGVVPLLVENPATHLTPEISMPDKLRPETNFTVSIKEKNGQGMAYTLAIVDEGLLDLTRFPTPEPWKAFYKREALGVKTWDMYQYVIGAYGGRMERLLSIGGDEAGRKVENNKVNRFKPVVKFVGPYYLKAGDEAEHTLRLDPYVGSVRVMVVAGDKGAYGQVEKTVPVMQPLMLLGTLPRVVGPGEQVMLPATVFAMEKEVKNVQVKASTNSLLKLDEPASQQLQFSEPDDQLAYFSLTVANATGAGKVNLEATSGAHKAHYTIDIPVRNPNPPITQMYQAVVKPGESWETTFAAPGMAGTNSAYAEISGLPSLNLGKRLEYLVQYPYGCVEQTVSSVFPQLYLTKVMPLKGEEKAKIEKNIKAGIDRLKQFQLASGAFAYWPGTAEENSWGSNYAGHFLLEAAAQGYHVPDEMLRAWKNWQQRAAAGWRNQQDDAYTQAYRLYTLALAGSPEMGAMNRFRERPNNNLVCKWRLAAAYALAGQEDVATTLAARLTTEVPAYERPGQTFGSSLRDKAMILETLLLLKREEEAMQLLMNISEQLSAERWLSTQTTAYCLVAGSKLYAKYRSDAPLEFASTFNGKSEDMSTGQQVLQSKLSVNEGKSNRYQMKNTGKSPLYVRVFATGIPLEGQEVNTENNLGLQVVYRTMDGERIDPAKLEQGTDFKAEVTVSNPGLRGDYENLALAQILPSGWEIHNNRLNDDGETKVPYDYQDIRDDRVYTFFSLKAREKKTFTVLLNSSYAGRFYLPALSCEAMYDNSISASLAGQWVDVVRPANP